MSLIDLITGMTGCLATIRRLGQRVRVPVAWGARRSRSAGFGNPLRVPILSSVVGNQEIRDNQPPDG